jgi:hypothetical protein
MFDLKLLKSRLYIIISFISNRLLFATKRIKNDVLVINIKGTVAIIAPQSNVLRTPKSSHITLFLKVQPKMQPSFIYL